MAAHQGINNRSVALDFEQIRLLLLKFGSVILTQRIGFGQVKELKLLSILGSFVY